MAEKKAKYAELLTQDEKKLAAEQVAERVETARLEIGNAKLQAMRNLNAAKAKEKAALRSTSFSSEAIIACGRQIEALEKDLQALTTLEQELF